MEPLMYVEIALSYEALTLIVLKGMNKESRIACQKSKLVVSILPYCMIC